MKKFLCVLCAVTILIFASASAVNAEEMTDEVTVGEGKLVFGYTDFSQRFSLMNSENLSGDIVIPEKVNGKQVTMIYHSNGPESSQWGTVCTPLEQEGVTSWTLPPTIEELFCSEIIDSCFFGGSELKEIVFQGDGPEVLPGACFAGAPNLERIVLPKKVKEMDAAFAFFSSTGYGGSQCTKVKEIVLDPSNPYFTKDDQGVIYTKDKTKLVTAAEGAAGRTELTIPNTVTTVAPGALCPNVDLRRIYGGANVTTINSDELSGCKNLNPFEDTYGHWGEESAKWAFQNQVFSGTKPFLFSPEGKMTRGMMVSVLHRLEGSPDPGWGSPFPDVPAPMYYAKPIKWASQNGIAVGYSASRFAPEETISREQMASMLYRYAQRKKEPMDTFARGDLTTFTDSGEISDYAEEAIAWAVGEGFLSGKGDGRLDPQGTATRAEVASMLQRFWER